MDDVILGEMRNEHARDGGRGGRPGRCCAEKVLQTRRFRRGVFADDRERAGRVGIMAENAISLLLVVDNASDARLLREALADGATPEFKLVLVPRLRKALERRVKRALALASTLELDRS